MDKHTRKKQSKWLSLFIRVAITVLAVTGIVVLQRSALTRPSLRSTNLEQEEQQEGMRLRLLKQVPTFGFKNLLADWTFLNFLQYYGDTPVRDKTGYSLSLQYFDLITQLDPQFVDIYLFLSGSISYQLGKPDFAVQLMDRGTAALSPRTQLKAFQVWRYKGLDQLLLLGDIPASIRSHDMAAQWVKGTPDESLAPLFEATAAFLRQDPDSMPVRVQAWLSIYYQAAASHDKNTQARAKREIIALGAQVQEQPDGQLDVKLPPPPPKKKSK